MVAMEVVKSGQIPDIVGGRAERICLEIDVIIDQFILSRFLKISEPSFRNKLLMKRILSFVFIGKRLST